MAAAIIWRGIWNSGVTYQPGSIVGYQNSTYLAIEISTGNIPSNHSKHWLLIAQMSGSGGGAQVNSDWNATIGAAAILNKPPVLVAEIRLDPPVAGPFSVEHGLNTVPTMVVVQQTSFGMIILDDANRFDATYINLIASHGPLTGYAEVFL